MLILLRILGSLLGDLVGALVKVPLEVAVKLGVVALFGALALSMVGYDPVAMAEQYLWNYAINRVSFW